MSEASGEDEARRIAVGLLARREHSRAELLDKLKRRGIDTGDAQRCLDALSGERLQSDERYAESYAGSRARRGYGPVRIRQELRQHGVSAELIEAALATVGEDWFELAADVLRRRFGSDRPTALRERAREHRFLEYRGFASDHIRTATGGD